MSSLANLLENLKNSGPHFREAAQLGNLRVLR